MKYIPLIIAILLLTAVSAAGQARTAERIVEVPFSQLNTGNPPDGHVRTLLNGSPGTTPCIAGSVKVFAIKLNGVWQCPNLAGGAGTGDVTGPSASVVGELALYNSTTGKTVGRSNALNGVVFATAGVATSLNTTGSGDVVRSTGPTITGVNASTIFGSGTIPPARIISNALTANKCLRLSAGGAIETAADDCGSGGGGGTPGGVSGNLQYNSGGVLAGALNTSYTSGTGTLTFSQQANGNDTLTGLRATDSSPTGTWLRLRNAANTTDLFSVAATGQVFASSTVLVKTTAAPSTPASGNTVLWTDSTDKNLKAQDDTGQVTLTVRAITCSGTDKVSGISSAGVVTCTADQGGAGTGVITLNTLTTSDQSFVAVDDTNIDLDISSAISTHTFTVNWVGTLAKARQHAATVYNDASNTWTTGNQSFAAATSLTLPVAAGASPTASGQVAYDFTSNTLEAGVNGTNRTVAFTAGSQTFTDKTLDNSTTANLRDTLLTLQDNADSTKTVNFELSNVASGTNRVVTIPNANSVTVQPSTVTSNQWVTHIDSAGVQQKAQPSFANISGTMGETQGGTGQTAYAQGDILYASTTNTLARLPKSTTATRYLSNTGASNNPAWAQVDLTNGVTGVLPVANWSVLTTKGDLLVHNGTTSVRQAVGATNGFVLKANSATSTGVEWAAVTATPGGSTTQLQYNNAGTLAGISGATTDGTITTFGAGSIIIGSQSATPTPALGKLYVDTDDSKLYFAFDGSTFGEVFVAGLSQVNLASANVTGVLPFANGGTNQTTWTASRCVQVNSAGTALESAAAACGGGGTPGGSDTQVQFNDGGAFGGDAGLTYNKTTDVLTVTGSIVVSASGAGNLEMAEGTAPTAVANRVTVAAPVDVTEAGGWVLSLPATNGTAGQFLQTDGNGVTTWATPGGSGTVTATGGSLTANSVVLGAGTTDTKVVAGIITDGTSKLTLGVAGTSVGGIDFKNATSGTVTLQPVTGALGTVTLSLPARTATIATTTGSFSTDDCAKFDASGNIVSAGAACGSGGSGANTALSNLASVAVNTSLLSDTDLTDDLGSVSIRWRDLFAGGVSISGKSVTTEADNTVGMLNASVTYAKNDSNTRTFHGAVFKPTLNTGGSNANTTLNVLIVDTINTSTTGLTTNLLNLAYGGTSKFKVGSDGTTTIGSSGTGILGLGDTDASHFLNITPGSNLTADRTLTLTTGDANRTLTMTGDLAMSGAFNLTLTTTGTTNVTLPTTGTLATVGGDIGAGTATTPSANDNDTSIATTAYVQTELTAYASDTKTLTNTTIDPEATGNVIRYIATPDFPAAGCNNTTASSFWDLPTSTPAVAACVTGTNTQKAYLDFADTSGGFSAQTGFRLPADFTGTIDAKITWLTTATSGNVKWSLSTICVATDATETDDPAFNTASTVTTAAPGVANRLQTSSITSVTITGCSAGEWIHVKIFRDGNDAADTIGATARLAGVQLLLRRDQ